MSLSANILLTWNDNASNEDGHKIYRSTTDATTGYSLVDTIAANLTSYTYQTTVSGDSWFKISSYNAKGETFCINPAFIYVRVGLFPEQYFTESSTFSYNLTGALKTNAFGYTSAVNIENTSFSYNLTGALQDNFSAYLSAVNPEIATFTYSLTGGMEDNITALTPGNNTVTENDVSFAFTMTGTLVLTAA